MISRRRFVQAGAAAVVVAGLPLPRFGLLVAGKAGATPVARAGPASGPSSDLFASASNFTPHLHTPFQGRLGGATGTLELTQVEDFAGRAGEAAGAARFSLLFDGARARAFPQGTYTLQHATLGSFAVFLVPVGRVGSIYQAVVNRRRG